MVSSDNLVLPPVQATSASVLLGLYFSLLFYGIVLCQGHWYFKTYREDPLDLKLTVAGILFANGISMGLIAHTCYYYAVVKSLNPDSFAHISNSLMLIPPSLFLSVSLCQYVYVRRTYLIIYARYRWMFIFVAVVLWVTAFVFMAFLTAQIAKNPTFEQWLKYKWLACATFGCAVVGDIILACILSLTLHGSRTGLKRMDALLTSIIINAFRSGIVTSMLNITCLLVAVFEGSNAFIIPFGLAVAKVYASATLITLNVRRDMSEKLMAPPGSDLIFASLSTFCRTQRQPEESEGTPKPEGVIGFGGESQSTVDSEV